MVMWDISPFMSYVFPENVCHPHYFVTVCTLNKSLAVGCYSLRRRRQRYIVPKNLRKELRFLLTSQCLGLLSLESAESC